MCSSRFQRLFINNSDGDNSIGNFVNNALSPVSIDPFPMFHLVSTSLIFRPSTTHAADFPGARGALRMMAGDGRSKVCPPPAPVSAIYSNP